MIALARSLQGSGHVELAGPVDSDVQDQVDAAVAEGIITWHGFIPNDRIGQLLRGGAVGLSLLSDDPNYRVSMPSKIIEYLAHGLPVVATPLPTVAALIEEEGGGLLVPFDDVEAMLAAVRRILSDPVLHGELSSQGRQAAARRTWEAEGERLVTMLRMWAA
jgi:glycosyltransferase involved in cell wall biosynthesis